MVITREQISDAVYDAVDDWQYEQHNTNPLVDLLEKMATQIAVLEGKVALLERRQPIYMGVDPVRRPLPVPLIGDGHVVD